MSCFVSFVLLVLMKLYNSLEVAHQSVKNDKMMSAYMSEFVSFNVLDPDYIKDKEQQKDIQLEQIELQVHTDEEVASITNEEREGERERERERNLSEIETKFLEVVDKIVEQEDDKEQIIPEKQY